MIFVVALDPDSIRACADQGPIGSDHLVGVFQAILQNCLMAEIAGTWRLGEELKEAVEMIPCQDARKKVKTMLEALLNPDHFRFVDVIEGYEDDHTTSAGEILASQGNNPELDVIVCEGKSERGSIEIVQIQSFNQSNFARERSRKACALIYAPRQKRAPELLREAFHRIARHADKIDLYDRQMGVSMGGNYHDAIEHWCAFFASFERKFTLNVHTTANQAASAKKKFLGHLQDSKVQLRVLAHLEDEQPHDRFLRGCGFTLDIGRGIDLFDRSGDCRDVKIGLSDHGEFTKQWRSLADTPPI